MSTYAYDQLVRAIRKARRNIQIDTCEAESAFPRVERQVGVDYVAEALAAILTDDDPTFDAKAFRKAAGA